MAKTNKEVTIELVNGVEGPCILINGYRVAGPKPWGGGRITKTWKASLTDIKTSISKEQMELHESVD